MNLASINSLRPAATPTPPKATAGSAEDVQKARDLQKAFSQFVGETFYGQMLKSMRATVGEPAYFHGGMAEEQFQTRLDQQLSTELSSGQGANDLAGSLFEHQFPEEAALLRQAEAAGEGESAGEERAGLAGLDTLRRW